MKTKTTKRLPLAGGTLIDRVGDVQIRLTSDNQIFVVRGNILSYPSLRGSTKVSFGNQMLDKKIPSKARARVLELLRKQKHIRLVHWKLEPDPVSFYNYDEHI